jgi:hypothetical protein
MCALFLFGSLVLIIRSATQFKEKLGHLTTHEFAQTSPRLLNLVAVEDALESLRHPAQWNFTGHSGLFVPEKHFIGPKGVPTTLHATVVHPPVPNDWFDKFKLPIAERDLLQQDPDGDGFTNLEEWENQTNPTEKESHPPFIAKLKLKSCSQEPLQIVFSSWVGKTFAINTTDLRRATQFLKLGDLIRGTHFKLIAFDEKYEANQYGTTIDVSELTLEHLGTHGRVTLVKEKVMTSPALVAHFIYSWGPTSEFCVRKEEQFSLKPEKHTQYKLVDIQPVRALVVDIKKPNEPIEILIP